MVHNPHAADRSARPAWLERFGLEDAAGLDLSDWTDEELREDQQLTAMHDGGDCFVATSGMTIREPGEPESARRLIG